MSKIQPNSKLLTKHNYVLHCAKIILKDTIMHTNGFYLIEYARHEHKIVVLNGIIKRITDDVLQNQKLKKTHPITTRQKPLGVSWWFIKLRIQY